MGIFQSAIIHQISLYQNWNPKPARYLILSSEMLLLLEQECKEMIVRGPLDGSTRRQTKTFMGLEIVVSKIEFGGSVSWALGE